MRRHRATKTSAGTEPVEQDAEIHEVDVAVAVQVGGIAVGRRAEAVQQDPEVDEVDVAVAVQITDTEDGRVPRDWPGRRCQMPRRLSSRR